MADEEYRTEIIIDINDADAVARAGKVEERMNRMSERMTRAARAINRQAIKPVIDVRDRLTEKVLAADRLVKKLSGEVATPVLTAHDEFSAVVQRMNAMMEAAAQGKHEVALGFRTEALAQIEKAEKAARVVSQMKGSPYMELGGPILQQLETAKERLTKLDLTKVEPLAALRDKLSSGLEKNKVKLKELSLAHASPILEAQDRVSAVVTRLNAMLEALDRGKVDVAAEMKGPLMEEISRARQALGALGNVKTGPVAELRGALFGDLGRAEGLLRDLDGMIARPKASLLDYASGGIKWIGSSLRGLTSRAWTVVIRAKDLASNIIGKIGRLITSPFTWLGVGIGGAGLGSLLHFVTMTAARTKTLNIAMDAVAAATKTNMDALLKQKRAVMDLGIAEQEATLILTRFMQAQLDVAQASKIARIAQDAAVIAGINSSEAAETMVEAVAKLRPELLAQFGMTRNLNDIFTDYAKTIGIVRYSKDRYGKRVAHLTRELSEVEKKQALLNYLFAEGAKITGTYEKSMNAAFKRLGSMARYVQSVANVIGGPLFEPALGAVVDILTDALKRVTRWFDANKTTVERWGLALERIAREGADRLVRWFERAFNTIDRLMKDPRFQKADLFGKTKILWDDIIAKPFEQWWSGGGQAWVVGAATRIGSLLATTIGKAVISNPIAAAIVGAQIAGPWGAAIGFGASAGLWFGKNVMPRTPAGRGTLWLDQQLTRWQEQREARRQENIYIPPSPMISVPPVYQPESKVPYRYCPQPDLADLVPGLTPFKRPVQRIPGYARGAIVTTPRLARIAERGPEAVIPLAPHMRERSFTLIRETERILGADEAPEVRAVPVGGAPVQPTTIMNIYMGEAVKSIEVHNGGDVDRAVEEVTNEIARRLKEVLLNRAS